MKDISNSADILDSRDIIERLQELTDERESLESALNEAKTELTENSDESLQKEREETCGQLEDALIEWDRDNEQELEALQTLNEEGSDYASDWRHGVTLIRDSYFETYAEELASDVSDYNPMKVHWPFTCIDWEKAADELKQDYTSIDFDGVEYLVCS